MRKAIHLPLIKAQVILLWLRGGIDGCMNRVNGDPKPDKPKKDRPSKVKPEPAPKDKKPESEPPPTAPNHEP